MPEALEEKSFRRAAFVRALLQIHGLISCNFENEEEEVFREEIRCADRDLCQSDEPDGSVTGIYLKPESEC